jgi:hypothetical protein
MGHPKLQDVLESNGHLCDVMAGLVPAIHVFLLSKKKAWMPGTRPGMTS